MSIEYQIIDLHSDDEYKKLFSSLRKNKMYANQHDNADIQSLEESYLYQLYRGKVDFKRLILVLGIDEEKIVACMTCDVDKTQVFEKNKTENLTLRDSIHHHFIAQHQEMFKGNKNNSDVFYLGEVNMYVKPTHRGQGIAHQMTSNFESYLLSEQKLISQINQRSHDIYFFKARDKAFDILSQVLVQSHVLKMSVFDPGFNMVSNHFIATMRQNQKLLVKILDDTVSTHHNF